MKQSHATVFITKQMSVVRKRMANVKTGRSRLILAPEAHQQVRQTLKKKT